MKIVINKCYGGFGLSDKAREMYAKLASVNKKQLDIYEIERNDPNLVKIIEELGKKANDSCAELKIIKIPDDIDYEIGEYDGIEWVAEKHRTWR